MYNRHLEQAFAARTISTISPDTYNRVSVSLARHITSVNKKKIRAFLDQTVAEVNDRHASRFVVRPSRMNLFVIEDGFGRDVALKLAQTLYKDLGPDRSKVMMMDHHLGCRRGGVPVLKS